MLLSGRTFDVIVDVGSPTPAIGYWGPPLGTIDDLHNIVDAIDRPLVAGAMSQVAPISVVPLHADGFPGRPGISGRRGGGRAWAPRFVRLSHRLAGNELTVVSVDTEADLELTTIFEVGHLLTVRVTITNPARTGTFSKR